jgi:hypothetical protein
MSESEFGQTECPGCAEKEKRFDNHTESVAAFLNELWAIMVDPLAEGTRTVAETMDGLRKAALREREAEYQRQNPPGWFLDRES